VKTEKQNPAFRMGEWARVFRTGDAIACPVSVIAQKTRFVQGKLCVAGPLENEFQFFVSRTAL
jgi:hypothetical protein